MTLRLPGGSLVSDLGVRWGLPGSYLVFPVSVYGFLFGYAKKFFDINN